MAGDVDELKEAIDEVCEGAAAFFTSSERRQRDPGWDADFIEVFSPPRASREAGRYGLFRGPALDALTGATCSRQWGGYGNGARLKQIRPTLARLASLGGLVSPLLDSDPGVNGPMRGGRSNYQGDLLGAFWGQWDLA